MAKLSMIMTNAMFVASLLLAPVTATAESMAFVQTADSKQITRISPRSTSSDIIVGLDDDGNAVIRFGKLTVSLNYEPGLRFQESSAQPASSVSHREVASLGGGLSVKIGVEF